MSWRNVPPALFALAAAGAVLAWAIPDGASPDSAERPPSAAAPVPGDGVASPNDEPRKSAEPARAESIVLLAGGDVSYGRMHGRTLLEDPSFDALRGLSPLFAAADVRFANLESPLSDQGGVTVHPDNPLVFSGPPEGADALARSGIDVVSLANNHAWDYGWDGLRQTLANLERVGVRAVGAGPDRESAEAWTPYEVRGFRVGFFAVTGIFNQRDSKPARQHVASADPERLAERVSALRKSGKVDAIVVSMHAGEEYMPFTTEGTRQTARAAIAAGADVVLGHHPHVVQGVEFVDGAPILYSLGNLAMRMNRSEPETEIGYLAQLTLFRNGPPTLRACPYRMFGLEPIPSVGDSAGDVTRERFRRRLSSTSLELGGVTVGDYDERGCATIRPKVGPSSTSAVAPPGSTRWAIRGKQPPGFGASLR